MVNNRSQWDLPWDPEIQNKHLHTWLSISFQLFWFERVFNCPLALFVLNEKQQQIDLKPTQNVAKSAQQWS